MVDYVSFFMTDLKKRFEGVVRPGSREARLLARLDSAKLPRHLAVIMDGNGRWAGQRGLPRVEGHRAGIEAVKSVVEFSARLGIPFLTLYAFSAENWKRPAEEVNTLWSLLRRYLRQELDTIQRNRIEFAAIGRLEELPVSVQQELKRVEMETRGNQRMRLTVALNYSGRLEIVDAVNRLWQEKVPFPITEENLENHLYTREMPDPDLLIRTSGEMRVSNFLLWQIAYSEIHVADCLWPDFRGRQLLEALVDYQRRERRYGGIRTNSYQSTS